MESQLVIPEWLVTYVGRQAITAEAQRVQDTATIAALRADVQRLQAPPEAQPARNGRSRRAIPAAVEG